MGVRLILQHQNQKLAVDLKNGAYVIGRDDRADIVVPDSTVSSRHAELQVLDDSCMIRDLGSSNGTFVNGEKIRAAKEIRPSDSIQVGAVPIGIEIKKESAAQPATPVAPTARLEAQKEVVREAKSKIPWNIQLFISGALSVLSLTLILMFVLMYSESAGSEQRIVYRMKTLAAQYVHILKDNPDATSVPPPSFDSSLAEPVMVANAKGEILYPVPVAKPDGTLPASPIVGKEGRVFEQLKLSMKKMDMKDEKGNTIEVRTYPVRFGGDLVGYVIARPNLDLESSFGTILMMLGMSAIVALVVLVFALAPVTKSVREQVDLLKSKISPLANGFINSLPRSRSFSELNDVAVEVENALSKKAAAGRGAGGAASSGVSEFVTMLGDLVDTASLPYCFVDQDFLIVSQNRATSSIGELAKAKVGASIFDCGMTNVQSRQLIEAVSEARKSGKGRAKVTLTWSDGAHQFDVSIQSFARGPSQDQIFGMLFRPSAG